MADFNIAYKKTSVVEGGYANDKNDSGGETWKGISRNNEKVWPGWAIVDAFKNKPGFPNNLYQSTELEAYVLQVYKRDYWNIMSLDKLQDQQVANELYDTGVNMGTGRAALFFQRVLNAVNKNGALFPDLKLDGQVGAKTIDCFNSLNQSDKNMVWRLLNCLQGEKYIDICEANPTQEKFMRSWASRVFES